MAEENSANEVRLVIGDQQREMAGWNNVRITRGIERLPSDFSLTLTEKYPGVTDVVVNAGDPFHLFLGADVVMTGYVDTISDGYDAQNHTVAAAGRSKCADLVDCAAEWPGMQIVNSDLAQIATQLATPYKGLGVQCDLTGMPTVQQLNILLGETPWSIIERVSRYSAALAYDNAAGDLVLARVGTSEAAGGFEEGVNVESAGTVFSMLDRFSEYMAVQQALDMLSDLPGGSLNVITKVTDGGVARRRQRVIIAENLSASGLAITEQRAVWEMNRRIARGAAVRVTTDSWRDAAGKLWEPNTLVPVHLPTLKVWRENLLVGEVTYRLDDEGEHADVLLMPPDAFAPQPFLLQPQFADVLGTDVRGIQ